MAAAPRAVAVAAALALPVAGCAAATPTPARPPAALPTPNPVVTVSDATIHAFAQPLPGLDDAGRRAFFVGNAFFNDPWVTAPSSTAGRDGLGPTFNATSCAACHFKDGRGAPPLAGRPERPGLLVRLSVIDSAGRPGPHPAYGDQIQDHAILGVPPEGKVAIAWEPVAGAYGDGTAYTLHRPAVTLSQLAFGPLVPAADAAAPTGAGVTVALSPRTAPAVFGLGLLEAVPEAAIVARADPDDADADGISGRPNRVPDGRGGGRALGRFGWKAGQPSIEHQAAAAFVGDIGITSARHPAADCPAVQIACAAAPDGGRPELDDAKLERIVHYNRTLAAPQARGATSPTVAAGAVLFAAAGCDGCHVPTLVTGRVGEVAAAALAEASFAPYTDLLLHDMGPGLADDRPEHEATGREWRTPPLWGVGLIPVVNGHDRLLHDGRARGIAEAILWHGGEAEAAKERFRTMAAGDRAALVAFVASR